ncbi:hypothetical protein [Sphingomonas sp.]|uniref:hypothetical protein n=1 Tax=Sphingomonas sp. TaxID=28214 RepID=UPI002DD696C9|nr:hypothetical protein [Sphingomonas sp.]
MAFQPFGYPIDIPSPMRPSALKAAIRARLTGWFDAGTGARGWIVGPYLCLWRSAFDRYGPMILARIVDEGSGSRIRGRAGSDLNGTIWIAILGLVMAAIAFADPGQSAVLLFFLALIPLILWLSHRSRRDADPLVRFLKETASPRAVARPSTLPARFDRQFSRPVTLLANGNPVTGPVTAQSVFEQVIGLAVDEFLVIEEAPEIYIQTLSQGDGYLLERRDGDRRRHYRAADRDGSESLSLDDVLGALISWAAGDAMPAHLSWKPWS